MTMRRTMGAILAVVGVVLGATPLPSAAQGEADAPARTGPRRVLIVSVPRLTWDDVTDRSPQAMTEFLAESAVGDLSLRTIGPRTALGEAYVTMGAGNRASAQNTDAGRVLKAGEPFESGTAREAFRRRTGVDSDAPLLQLSIVAINALNNRFLYGAKPGTFGEVLGDDGFTPSVIGNAGIEADAGESVADPAAPTGEPDDGQLESNLPITAGPDPITDGGEALRSANRSAGLVVMNRRGEIPSGNVDNTLLTRDPDSAFGVALSGSRVVAQLDRVWEDDSVVLVELSDLERADYYRGRASSRQADALVQRAFDQTDNIFREVIKRTGPDDLVILVSPVAPRSGETLTPLAVRGPGFDSGTMSSGTTRRDGYVTLPDIAPMVLDQLGISQPDAMTGAPVSIQRRGDTSPQRYQDFEQANQQARFRDDIAVNITLIFVLLQVLLYASAVAVLLRPSRRLRRWTGGLGLVTMSTPVVTFLLGLVRLDRHGFGAYLLAMFAGAGAVAALAVLVGRGVDARRRRVLVPLVPIVLTYVVLLVDMFTGGRLQINTVFGYSPVVAGRFSGFGNSAYGLFAISSVLMAAGAWALAGNPEDGPRRRPMVVAIVALFLLTVVVDGHPALGSDVGGILSIIPAGFVVVWLLLGRRIRLRTVVFSALATAALLAVFAIVDLQRPAATQTHLGRLVRSTLGADGLAGLVEVVMRKLNTNLSLLFTSTWSWSVPLALLVLVLVMWRRPAVIERHLVEQPTLRACLWGGIAMCFLGMAVNDSGVSVPSVMFTLFLPYVLYQVTDGAVPPEHPAPEVQAGHPAGPDGAGATTPSADESVVGSPERTVPEPAGR